MLAAKLDELYGQAFEDFFLIMPRFLGTGLEE
jgi:hypothetical protein